MCHPHIPMVWKATPRACKMCQDFNGPFSESAGKDTINPTSVVAVSQPMQHELLEFVLTMDTIIFFGIRGSDPVDSAVPGKRHLQEEHMGPSDGIPIHLIRRSIICQLIQQPMGTRQNLIVDKKLSQRPTDTSRVRCQWKTCSLEAKDDNELSRRAIYSMTEINVQ